MLPLGHKLQAVPAGFTILLSMIAVNTLITDLPGVCITWGNTWIWDRGNGVKMRYCGQIIVLWIVECTGVSGIHPVLTALVTQIPHMTDKVPLFRITGLVITHLKLISLGKLLQILICNTLVIQQVTVTGIIYQGRINYLHSCLGHSVLQQLACPFVAYTGISGNKLRGNQFTCSVKWAKQRQRLLGPPLLLKGDSLFHNKVWSSGKRLVTHFRRFIKQLIPLKHLTHINKTTQRHIAGRHNLQ